MGAASGEDADVADILLRVATFVAIAVMLSTTVAGVAALVLPWWSANSELSSSALTLWAAALSDFDVLQVARIAIVILPTLSIGATVGTYASRQMSKLLLLLGAVLSLGSGCCGALAIILRLNISFKSMGTGLFACAAATVLSGFGTVAALYAAAVAMPRESMDGSDDNGSTRQARAQAARQRAQDEAAELERNVRRARSPTSAPTLPGGQITARSNRSDGGSDRQGSVSEDSGSLAGQKKVPAVLRQVLFWSQEEGGNEPVPTALLELAFQEIDEDGSGSIDLDELVESLRLCGLNASQAAADAIMKEIDKNASGDVDIHEFVEFFRTIEEMNQFEKRTEQRAQFLAVFCNTCFLLLIIIDGVLLMMFLKMDQESSGDDYSIMKNLLIACSCVLGILFLCVVAIPATRLTLGPNMTVWSKHFYDALDERKAKRKPKDMDDQTGAALRQAAWGGAHRGSTRQGAEGEVQAPTVNAALFGASYRVRKVLMDQSSGFDAQAMTRFPGEEQWAPPSKTFWEPPPATTLPGVIFDLNGEFERYDPAAYRSAALRAMDSKLPVHFSPMQGNNVAPPEDEPAGVLALTNASFYSAR